MRRRDFVKITAAGAMALALGTRAFAQDNDFFPVKRLRNVDSLEKILRLGHKGITETSSVPEKINIMVDYTNLQSLLYFFDMGIKNRRRECLLATEQEVGIGSCHILTDEGIFLTNHHVFRNFLKKEMNLAVLYNPYEKFIREPEVLAYSEGYDLLLGKIDVPGGFHVNPLFLSKGAVNEGSYVYTLTFDPKLFSSDKVILEVFDSFGIDFECDGSIYSIQQNRNPHIDINSLGLRVHQSEAVGLTMEGRPFSDPGYFNVPGMKNEGNSGTFAFSLYHDIVGVLGGGRNCTNCIGDEVVERYVGPERIREFVSWYFTECTGRQPRTELTPEEQESRRYKSIVEKPIPLP